MDPLKRFKLTARMFSALASHESSPAKILVGTTMTLQALERRGLACKNGSFFVITKFGLAAHEEIVRTREERAAQRLRQDKLRRGMK